MVFGNHPKEDTIELNGQVTHAVIQVHVDGAVVNPGVYFLDEDCRVLDALAAAGGYSRRRTLRGLIWRRVYTICKNWTFLILQMLRIFPLSDDDGKVSMNTPMPAIDIAAGEGSPIYAADTGMVRLEGNDNSGYGNIIEIDHGNGYSTVYAHLRVIGVAGQRVCAGQRIGASGGIGNSTGAHLHFEVIQDGAYTDPWSVLPVP